MSSQKLIEALTFQLKLLKGKNPDDFMAQPPGIVVAMVFVQHGFKHIQQTINNSAHNPWHELENIRDDDIHDADSWFKQAKERVGTRVQNDFSDFVFLVEKQISGHTYKVLADEQVKSLVDEVVDELGRIIVTKEK
jgi:hypothetical protein